MAYKILQDGVPATSPSSPVPLLSHAPLQPRWLLCTSIDTPGMTLPQGLCTCVLCLEPSPGCPHGSLPHLCQIFQISPSQEGLPLPCSPSFSYMDYLLV